MLLSCLLHKFRYSVIRYGIHSPEILETLNIHTSEPEYHSRVLNVSVVSHGKRQACPIYDICISGCIYDNLSSDLRHTILGVYDDSLKAVLILDHPYYACVIIDACSGFKHHILRCFLPTLRIKGNQKGLAVYLRLGNMTSSYHFLIEPVRPSENCLLRSLCLRILASVEQSAKGSRISCYSCTSKKAKTFNQYRL